MAGRFASSTLDDVGVQALHLVGEHVGDGVRELLRVAVVAVVQHLRQHVRPGERELERLARERAAAGAGDRQVQAARADRPLDHAGGLARKRVAAPLA
jgi:hypothetical protein